MIKIFVMANDAGAANILSALIRKYRHNFEWIFYSTGPAKGIFLRDKINLYAQQAYFKNNNIDALLKLKQLELVLTGTGWQSKSYLNFIESAKRNKIKTAVFLDHWCYYRERFGYPGNWITNLPDFVFVGDRMAYKIALKNGFPKNILVQVENPYFEEIIKRRKIITKGIKDFSKKKLKLLYFSQSFYKNAIKIIRNPDYWKYDEYKILRGLLDANNFKKNNFLGRLKIRLHPSEKINKYDRLLRDKKYNAVRKFIAISNPNENDLIQDCKWADAAIGLDSMALVIAFLIGIKAVSYNPNKILENFLFQRGIKKVYALDSLMRELKNFKNKYCIGVVKKKNAVVPVDLFFLKINRILN